MRGTAANMARSTAPTLHENVEARKGNEVLHYLAEVVQHRLDRLRLMEFGFIHPFANEPSESVEKPVRSIHLIGAN